MIPYAKIPYRLSKEEVSIKLESLLLRKQTKGDLRFPLKRSRELAYLFSGK